MSILRVTTLLKERMGLDAASIGTAAIERAVQVRLTTCGASDEEAYWEHLSTSEAELQELIEAVVVPETWFFRDREAFAALTSIARAARSSRATQEPFRVLSLPCATGEEPFSIAMALLDSGLPAQHFQIDAVDISARALACAERALYRGNSFRGQQLGFREQHFTAVEQAYQLSDVIRRQVRFRQANLFAVGAFPTPQVYDAIFCRNVLIYFDRAGRKHAVGLLSRLLQPGGTLFVGPSETALLLDYDFVSARIPLAFAFRRTPATPAAPRVTVKAVPPARPAASYGPKVMSATAEGAAPAQAHSAPALTWLEEAQRLADQGKVADALQYCQHHLRAAPSAQAFYLVGLLHDALDEREQARAHYRKALYLEPTHREALAHLAEALIRDGATREAQILLDRAKRIPAPDAAT